MKIKLAKKNTTSFKPLFKRKIDVFRRFTLILVLFSIAGFTAGAVSAQNSKVNINARNIDLKDVLGEIEKQTDYLFIYNPAEVNLNAKTSLNIQNKDVPEVLNTVFNKTGISYRVEGNSIMLVKAADQDQKVITGTIVDEIGEPLIGTTVMIKGTTQGTITDLDGNYSLNAAKGDILEIAYLGYNSQSITVGDQNVYNFQMALETQELGAVVVTALGIKRSEKALSYNVQQVGQEELTRVKDANFINSLSGKVAGVTINASSSGVGGASKVVMRGVKSIGQSSNALYVIDGVPMFNLGGEGDTEFGSSGTTEAIADINPEDIESLSVLTGAAAAALYGNNAANGVVLITTKKGKAGQTNITFSQNTDFLRPLVMPQFQNRYGIGSLLTPNVAVSDKSWGNLLNASNYMGYSPKDDYLNTGVVATETVTFSTGTDRNQTYASFGAVDSKGMIPNNKYSRYNFTFRNTTSFLNDKMTLDVGANYIKQEDRNMTNQGIYQNPLVSAYLYPRGDDWENTKMYEYYSTERRISIQNWPQGINEYVGQNPYWTNYRNLRTNNKDRYMLNASLNYQILDWLSVSGRVRVDNSETNFEEKLYASTNTTLTGGSENGLYSTKKSPTNKPMPTCL